MSKVSPSCFLPVRPFKKIHVFVMLVFLVFLFLFSFLDLARLPLQMPPFSQLTVFVAHFHEEAERALWIRGALLLPVSADPLTL